MVLLGQLEHLGLVQFDIHFPNYEVTLGSYVLAMNIFREIQ